MKKTTINISYDEEKLSALKIYLEQKSLELEDELIKELDTLCLQMFVSLLSCDPALHLRLQNKKHSDRRRKSLDHLSAR